MRIHELKVTRKDRERGGGEDRRDTRTLHIHGLHTSGENGSYELRSSGLVTALL